MPTLKILTGRICEGAYALLQMDEKQRDFKQSLMSPRRHLESFPGNRKDFSSLTKYLDAAEASVQKAIDNFREKLRGTVRSFFGGQGIAVGAVIELDYPVYELTLDDDLAGDERLAMKKKAIIKVDAFSIQRARSHSDVVLNIVGYRKSKNGRFGKETELFRLEPGYEFKVIKPAE